MNSAFSKAVASEPVSQSSLLNIRVALTLLYSNLALASVTMIFFRLDWMVTSFFFMARYSNIPV